MVNTYPSIVTKVNTSVELECPVCHSIFQLIHLEPSGMHELLDLVDAAQKSSIDLVLPTLEEIRMMIKEVDRKFYEENRGH